ncbi:hypothetical protein BKA70DRAFT_1417029 [Coprinopsis sp. MPI-PUGE-AT-0042]|nr:hypothetical protein BKA70DRAFT_1417029 [Coprinopsis sp. MPI-PUGE-AT-0042]
MYASHSSPPPQDLDVGLLVPTPALPLAVSGTVTGNNSPRSSVPPTTTAQGRKRKRGQAASTSHAASPAPSDTGNNTNGSATGNDSLLASRADLYSRPMLTIMRGPLFIPTTSESSSEFYRTEGTGVNRVGFRYVPAGINPPGTITPCRTIESAPTSFRVSWEDRSPHIRVSKDGLGLQGFRGFRSARCNAPVREGKWYLEVKIVNGGGDRFDNVEGSSKAKEGNHVRIGWGRREATLNGPVGLDGYSYAIRDKTGEKVTLSRARPYAPKGFKSGDVVGMYISLPPLRQPAKKDPHDPAHIHRERIPIDLKGQEYFEILEYPTSKEMLSLMDYSGKTTNTASVPSAVNTKKPAAGAKPPERPSAAEETKTKKALNDPPLRPLPTLPGSRIAFFINGEPQGIAFQDIYDFLPLRQTADEQKRKAKDRTRRAREGVKEHRENPFDDGTLGYYPMISLFNDAVVTLNPGPNFEFPPPRDIDAVLEGRPQPEVEVAPPASTTIEDATMNVGSNVPVKAEPEPVSLDVPMDLDTNTVGETKPPPPATHQLWRPVADRYPEFMQEQWKLDQIEEDEAKIEYERQAAKASGAAAKGGAGKKGGAGGKAGSAAKGKAAAGGGTKKKGTAGAEAETPEMATPAPEGAPNAPAKKRAKKATAAAAAATAGQLSGPGIPGTVPSSSGAATPALSDIIPRSATETPFGTPPPPSVSSTAAAAAAAFAHLHQVQVQSGGATGSGGGYAQQQQQLQGPGQAYYQVQNPQLQSQQQQYSGDPRQYHHALVRSESNSNRPSPSPLRQSTAYRDERTGMGGYDDYDLPAVHARSTPIPVTVAPPSPSTSMTAAGDPELGVYPGQGDEDEGQDEEVFATSNHGSAISQAQVRHKKPPGSQRGRVHAQQAALAAAGLVQPQPLHPLQQQLQHSQLQQHDSYSLLDSRDPGQSAQAIARMGAHQATTARGLRGYEDNEEDQDDDEEQEGVEDNDDQEVGRPRSEYDSSNGGGGTPGDYEMGEDEQSDKGDGDEDSTPGEFDREERDGEDDEDGGEGGGGATTDDEERDGDVDMGGESRRDHRHDDGP